MKHFTVQPDDYFGPRVTLCGTISDEATNWDAAGVTCDKCLEAMEEHAVGEAKTLQVHDEIITEKGNMVVGAALPELPKTFESYSTTWAPDYYGRVKLLEMLKGMEDARQTAWEKYAREDAKTAAATKKTYTDDITDALKFIREKYHFARVKEKKS